MLFVLWRFKYNIITYFHYCKVLVSLDDVNKRNKIHITELSTVSDICVWCMYLSEQAKLSYGDIYLRSNYMQIHNIIKNYLKS